MTFYELEELHYITPIENMRSILEHSQYIEICIKLGTEVKSI